MASKNTPQNSYTGNRVKTHVTGLSPARVDIVGASRASVPVRKGTASSATRVSTTKPGTTAKPVQG